MNATSKRLETLSQTQKKFLKRGGLCVGLVITRTAKDRVLPLDPVDLRTEEGGQVAGLGKAAVQKILEDHGITKVLAEEGGRTSRGSLGLMEIYAKVLNELHAKGTLNLEDAEDWWIAKVKAHFAAEGPKFHFDAGKSLRSNINDLLEQAEELQESGSGTNYVGAMLQHLIGAKFDLVLGEGKIEHHGFSVADHSTNRKADFQIDTVSIHVTTSPSEGLVRKCSENLKDGLKPVILTIGENVLAACTLLKNAQISDRVDVLDVTQFLTANVYEHSLFQAADCKITLVKLLNRYNAIVSLCEADPSLKISLGKSGL